MANETEVTTVRLYENAQIIKEDLAPIYGLKNILSAGLLLFSRLSSDEQKRTIREVSTSDPKLVVDSLSARAEQASKRVGKRRPAS